MVHQPYFFILILECTTFAHHLPSVWQMLCAPRFWTPVFSASRASSPRDGGKPQLGGFRKVMGIPKIDGFLMEYPTEINGISWNIPFKWMIIIDYHWLSGYSLTSIWSTHIICTVSTEEGSPCYTVSGFPMDNIWESHGITNWLAPFSRPCDR